MSEFDYIVGIPGIYDLTFLQPTPPLYNTIVGVQAHFCVNYLNRAIQRVKCIIYIGKKSLVTIWGPALIRVISKTMLKRTML